MIMIMNLERNAVNTLLYLTKRNAYCTITPIQYKHKPPEVRSTIQSQHPAASEKIDAEVHLLPPAAPCHSHNNTMDQVQENR